jgi:hypothetical protein
MACSGCAKRRELREQAWQEKLARLEAQKQQQQQQQQQNIQASGK